MSKIKRTKHFSMEKKDARAGFLFICPWLFGFLFLFCRSLIDSIRYSVSDLKLGAFGMRLDFVGMDHYVAAFKSDPFFVENLLKALSRMAYEVPIILFFSLFIAILLNQKFRGRTISRALFFLPVIVASGVVINALKSRAGMNIGVDLQGDVINRAVDTTFIFQADRLSEVLLQTGLSPRIVEFFTGIVNRVFDLSWKSGIQILVYLTGLQAIPHEYYEVSAIEGASRWEYFWKIVFPTISPYSLVCIVYTVIDSFTYMTNPVMDMVYKTFQELRVGFSAAISWIYFILVFIVVLILFFYASKKVIYSR